MTAAARAAYAANPQPGLPVSEFNPAGGPIFASSSHRSVYSTPGDAFSPEVRRRLHARGARRQDGVPRRLRDLLRHLRDDGRSAAGVQPVDAVRGDARRVPDAGGDVVESVPGRHPPAGGAARGLDQNLGQTLTYTNPSLASPTRAVNRRRAARAGSGIVVEGTYAYSEFRDLPVTLAQSYTLRSFLSTSSVRDQETINRLTANVPNPFQGLLPGTSLNGPTIAYEQLVRLYPQYTGLTEQRQRRQLRSAHAVGDRAEAVLARHAAARDLHALDDEGVDLQAEPVGRRARAPHRQRGPAHRFVLSGVYALPFGEGQRSAAGRQPWVRTVIGGWSVSGIYTYQSGAVLTWGNVIYLGGDLEWDPRNVDRAFNIAAFNTNPHSSSIATSGRCRRISASSGSTPSIR